MSKSTFAGLTISADLAGRLMLLTPHDRTRLEERVRQRRGRWLGGRELGEVMEARLFARDTAGWRYYRALMRIDRRA